MEASRCILSSHSKASYFGSALWHMLSTLRSLRSTRGFSLFSVGKLSASGNIKAVTLSLAKHYSISPGCGDNRANAKLHFTGIFGLWWRTVLAHGLCCSNCTNTVMAIHGQAQGQSSSNTKWWNFASFFYLTVRGLGLRWCYTWSVFLGRPIPESEALQKS